MLVIQPHDEHQGPSPLHGQDPWTVCEVALKSLGDYPQAVRAHVPK